MSLNLKIFSAKHGVEFPAGADRITRLERVVPYLDDFGDLGPVDEPGQFFGGLMRWGPFHGTSLVYFGGEDKTGAVVGLGGSGKHVLGTSGQSDEHALARSVTPSLLDGLAAEPEIGDLFGVGGGIDDDALRAVALLKAATERGARTAERWLTGPAEPGEPAQVDHPVRQNAG